MADITILGAYGTKSHGKGTTSFGLNPSHVIDAGNLLDMLDSDVSKLDAIWLTHSHLDHIVDIAFLLSTYFAYRDKPLQIMGLPETLEAVRVHFLNGKIWPDFSGIPLIDSQSMSLEYTPIDIGTRYDIGYGMHIEPIAADHIIPCCGYIVTKEDGALVISSDTYSLAPLIEAVHARPEIHSAVIECSFPSEMEELAKASKHLTPKLLFEALEMCERRDLNIYVNHIKPNYQTKIIEEITALKGAWNCIVLDDGDKISF